MSDVNKLSISYFELKEITEKHLLNRLKMKEQAEQSYDYAKFHAQGQAILDMWHEIVLAGSVPSEQIAADLVYFKNILEPSRW
ncbi:hypothetical protein AVB85_22540 [Salmonella enterica subsp. enterica serovar Vitkin]|nr:hypothetical protein [Salmonella enterica subsp. enterica serovar Vitkin]EAO9636325.1 hypothetical protein [Salmonella enterica]EBS4877590.1 hypothetical protein [Salmonella enterica subsp. enterica serovar Hvittingfoss]EBU9251973.1 hypothetical protein [Salmonella enterica subsp. enterica serovar Oslo]EDE9842287.1 hypothetical protein [Salmonella enterica subsp. enterica serovar Ealing]EDS8307635.1 hypothetical protein [Salmonella enterica subsp. enterica serovar Java]EEP8339752.1 hypothe